MLVIGLTGSIGMGKSVTAALFAAAGVPVHDADAVVHELYGGAAVPAIKAAFPAHDHRAGVDRERLAARVLADPTALPRLESIVHPLVRQSQAAFLAAAADRGARVAVLDVPLLLERGGRSRSIWW